MPPESEEKPGMDQDLELEYAILTQKSKALAKVFINYCRVHNIKDNVILHCIPNMLCSYFCSIGVLPEDFDNVVDYLKKEFRNFISFRDEEINRLRNGKPFENHES